MFNQVRESLEGIVIGLVLVAICAGVAVSNHHIDKLTTQLVCGTMR